MIDRDVRGRDVTDRDVQVGAHDEELVLHADPLVELHQREGDGRQPDGGVAEHAVPDAPEEEVRVHALRDPLNQSRRPAQGWGKCYDKQMNIIRSV